MRGHILVVDKHTAPVDTGSVVDFPSRQRAPVLDSHVNSDRHGWGGMRITDRAPRACTALPLGSDTNRVSPVPLTDSAYRLPLRRMVGLSISTEWTPRCFDANRGIAAYHRPSHGGRMPCTPCPNGSAACAGPLPEIDEMMGDYTSNQPSRLAVTARSETGSRPRKCMQSRK